MPTGDTGKRRAQESYRKLEPKVRELVENQKIQQVRVAKMLGIGENTVLRICKFCGIKTQRTGPRSGPGHYQSWKGGRRFVGGYWYIYSPDHPYKTTFDTVAEHRLVMEKKLGRYLNHSEVVHHINGKRDDNRLENLILFQTNGKHLAHELKGKCPKWTPEGKKSILKAIRQKRIPRK